MSSFFSNLFLLLPLGQLLGVIRYTHIFIMWESINTNKIVFWGSEPEIFALMNITSNMTATWELCPSPASSPTQVSLLPQGSALFVHNNYILWQYWALTLEACFRWSRHSSKEDCFEVFMMRICFWDCHFPWMAFKRIKVGAVWYKNIAL